MNEVILVLDYGSQYNQLIIRKIRELGVYSLLVPHGISALDLKRHNAKGFIFTGGPNSVYGKGTPKINKNVLNTGLPVLGICYGMQVLTHCLGGKVKKGKKREYGLNNFIINKNTGLFEELERKNKCWMSHGDEVILPAPGFDILAYSEDGCVAAVGDVKRKYYGVQFHPEVAHTLCGKKIFKNFLKICGVGFNFSYKDFVKDAVVSIKNETENAHVFCALSGGVDSLVAADLVSRAVGGRLKCVFVDNGLLRLNEEIEVRKNIAKHTNLDLKKIDARGRFLKKLKNVKDPERKRKIIGNLFIKIFEEEALKIKNLKFLVQGTIYPDYIESGGMQSSSASVIKTHHNVGGLPKKMKLKIIEPLKFLFKDEVRKVGLELGLPHELIFRQPFPGPGLAVRIIGDVKDADLKILKYADKILREELEKEKINENIWQYFAVLLPVKTVGVMGDLRTYLKTIALRCVQSEDGMTANVAEIPWSVLHRISTRIVNEVKGVNRVVYDLTSKPPGTIEWE